MALKVELAAPELGWVAADPARLRKVFFHLIGNAVKFTHRGPGRHRARGRRRRRRASAAARGRRHRHRHRARERRRVVFKQFSQARRLGRRVGFGGPGLGLAITRQLAEMMGGDVALHQRRRPRLHLLGRGERAGRAPPQAAGRAGTSGWLAGRQGAGGGGQPDQPAGRHPHAGPARRRGGDRRERRRGRRGGRGRRLRPGLHGHPDAGDGRRRGHPPHPRHARAQVCRCRSSRPPPT